MSGPGAILTIPGAVEHSERSINLALSNVCFHHWMMDGCHMRGLYAPKLQCQSISGGGKENDYKFSLGLNL